MDFYMKNYQSILTIQSGLRMFKAIKVARRLKKVKGKQNRAAKSF